MPHANNIYATSTLLQLRWKISWGGIKNELLLREHTKLLFVEASVFQLPSVRCMWLLFVMRVWGVGTLGSVKLHHGNPGMELGSFAEWSIFDLWKGMSSGCNFGCVRFRATRGKSFLRHVVSNSREFTMNCAYEKQSAFMSRRGEATLKGIRSTLFLTKCCSLAC